MRIYQESIHHYLAWIRNGTRFSFAGFSDAEWYCLLGQKAGEKTGLGQVLSPKHGLRLLDVLKRRSAPQAGRRWLFAVPRCLWPHGVEAIGSPWPVFAPGLPGFAEGQIDWFLGYHNLRIDGYERDMVTDDLSREAEMYPFLRHLQDMQTCLIGNEALEPVVGMLKYHGFVGIESPNLHLKDGGIESAVERAFQWGRVRGPNQFYLVCAGVSAAIIIDRLTTLLPSAWFWDAGSTLDAFVKIGEQRAWRAELYRDETKWRRWVVDNREGKHAPDSAF